MTRRPIIRRPVVLVTEADARAFGAMLLTITGIVAVMLGAVVLVGV